jgi:hypothetical protein
VRINLKNNHRQQSGGVDRNGNPSRISDKSSNPSCLLPLPPFSEYERPLHAAGFQIVSFSLKKNRTFCQSVAFSKLCISKFSSEPFKQWVCVGAE